MPVAVRNQESGPTVFSIPEDNLQVEWQGRGDPEGGDVQYVPDSLLTNVQFDKVVRRGILQVIGDEASANEAIDKQAAAYRGRADAAAAEAVASIEQAADNDLVQAPCIGPSNRGQGECGEPVPVREKDLRNNDAPVLCSRHVSLAPQYARIETDQMIESGDSLVPVTKWVRSQVERTQRKTQ